MKYIELSVVLNEVKRFMNSYFESDTDIDNSIFVPDIRLLLTKFGLKTKNKNNTVINIKNYKGELPYNFYKLIFAVGCFQKKEFIEDISNFYNITKIEEISTNYKINNCENSCINECGENVHVIQKIDEGKLITYNEFYPLFVSRTKKNIECLGNDCFNFNVKNKENEFTINNNYIETNFSDGNIYIEYYENFYNEDGELLIPDHEVLIKAVKEQIKLTILEYILFNNPDPNITGKYQLQQQLTQTAIFHAVNLIKQNEVNDIKKIRNYFVDRYDLFEKMINGK